MTEGNKDEIVIKGIKESLDSMEGLNIKVPDMGFFRNIVAEVEKKKEKRKRKETFVFMLSAVILLSMETYAYNQSVKYFITFQVIALISLPVMLLAGLKRRRGKKI